ncbi:MAG TPA: DUF882 domain-containing protein [Steroidobacteraceae bacterium]|jgi:uncharacterized protein YcbK (DUF882 family)|nr:DUF882 domain-containing protein [Steroidobacteraceae bacterium]
MTWSRRRVLRAGGALAGMSAGLLIGTARAREAAANRPGSEPERIGLLNLHTREQLDIEYLRDGAYLPDALAAIEVVLRDFRTGERHMIDPRLMDYLVEVARAVGADPAFSVISGYRSPQTNAQLHEKSSGVAQHSLHMEGRAIDVRMTGVDCASLASHAQRLKRGGVGYYRASDFVHLDTGKFRTWKG